MLRFAAGGNGLKERVAEEANKNLAKHQTPAFLNRSAGLTTPMLSSMLRSWFARLES